MTEDNEEYLTIHQVCAILQMKPQAVRNLYKKQGMPVLRISSNNIRFKKTEVDRFIKEHSVIYKTTE